MQSFWSVWKKVWTMFESIWETALKNMPIIPINWWALTFQSLQEAPGLINQKLNEATAQSEKNLNALFSKNSWNSWSKWWESGAKWFFADGQSKSFMTYFSLSADSEPAAVFWKLAEVQSLENWWSYANSQAVMNEIQNYMKKKDIPDEYLNREWNFWGKKYSIKKESDENKFSEVATQATPQGA